MQPNSPCLITTAFTETPSEVWLGKARYEAEKVAPEVAPDHRRTRKTSRRNWVQLGGLLLLSGLICCVASCTVPRDAPSTRAAPFVSADCQYSGLSVLLQQFHLGAQVHFHLRNLHCQQEQEVEPQHTERMSAPYADCRADPAGLLQRFHLGAQVPYPPTHTLTHPHTQLLAFDPSAQVIASIPRSLAPLNLSSDHTPQVSRVLRERECLAAWTRDL